MNRGNDPFVVDGKKYVRLGGKLYRLVGREQGVVLVKAGATVYKWYTAASTHLLDWRKREIENFARDRKVAPSTERALARGTVAFAFEVSEDEIS